MASVVRRTFLKQTGKLGAGLAGGITLLGSAASVRAAPANERVALAVIGCGGRGTQLARDFAARTDCRVAYLADVNTHGLEAKAGSVAAQQGGEMPRLVQDFRRALDDQQVDAVVIATPDHWHALATVLACQAGKDVYVEKPPTHNCWEGQQMVKAAREHKRIVQCGFQNRSAPYNMAAKQYIEQGKLGNIHLCRIFNQKPPWGNCPVVSDSDPPPGLDWEMWNGPAPEQNFNASKYGCWNHQWVYSGGDIANDASHQIDLARWLLGAEHPETVYSTGGRYDVQSAAQTPDSQIAVYQLADMLVSFELTLFTPYMLKTDAGVRDSDMFPDWLQNGTRIEIYGTNGMMVVGRHGGGWQVFVRPSNRQRVVKDQHYGRFPDPEHKENFLQCIRSRETPNADIAEGHLSTLWIHYANISYRLGGEKLAIDSGSDKILDNGPAMALFKREYREPWVLREKA